MRGSPGGADNKYGGFSFLLRKLHGSRIVFEEAITPFHGGHKVSTLLKRPNRIEIKKKKSPHRQYIPARGASRTGYRYAGERELSVIENRAARLARGTAGTVTRTTSAPHSRHVELEARHVLPMAHTPLRQRPCIGRVQGNPQTGLEHIQTKTTDGTRIPHGSDERVGRRVSDKLHASLDRFPENGAPPPTDFPAGKKSILRVRRSPVRMTVSTTKEKKTKEMSEARALQRRSLRALSLVRCYGYGSTSRTSMRTLKRYLTKFKRHIATPFSKCLVYFIPERHLHTLPFRQSLGA